MSVSLNSFFFPKGECVGTLILISEGLFKVISDRVRHKRLQ